MNNGRSLMGWLNSKTKSADIDVPHNTNLRRSICNAPSVNMLFSTDGVVKACCHNHENSLGKYPEQTIKEIWNSAEAVKFRASMAQRKFLSGCHECAADYNSGNIDQMYARHFDTLVPNYKYPSMMEFLLDNTCNLECVMCTGELSSTIRANRDRMPPIQSPYDDNFIKQLDEFIPYLRETRFSGSGEAFSIAKNYKIWDKLIAVNPNCLIVVQTNGTILNTRVKDYLARGNFIIGVSVDSLDKTKYESIRLNADFDRVMDNLGYFSEYSKQRGNPLTISMCVMRDNWQELPNFVTFCNRIGANLILHKVWSPLSHAIHNLPSEHLEGIFKRLSSYSFNPTDELMMRNIAHYKYFLSVISCWCSSAKKKETSVEDYTSKSNEELFETVSRNIIGYLHSGQMIESNIEDVSRICIGKLKAVLDLWPNGEDKRMLLLKLCQIPPSEMIPSLKNKSIEKLWEMSKLN